MKITAKHIFDRKEKLMLAAGGRDAEMARMGQYFGMDTWGDEKPTDGSQRVSLPIAYDAVTKTKAMLISRPPSVSVVCAHDMADDAKTQLHEQVLYGYVAQAQLWQHLADALWYGLTFGRGYLKRVFDAEAIDGDWPIPTYAIDPRRVYGVRDITDRHYTELVHTWMRSRREIEDEGYTLRGDRPSDDDETRLDTWLDEEVAWTEYWFTKVVDSSQKSEVSRQMGEEAGEVGEMGEGMAEEVGEGEALTPKPKTKRERAVYHAIAVEDAQGVKGADKERRGYLVKKPLRMMGYKRIPFYSVDGIRIPTKPEGTSLLYPMVGGDGPAWAQGLIGSSNMLLSLFLDAAAQASHPTAKTNDEGVMANWKQDAGAINLVPQGAYFDYVIPPAGNPALLRTMEQLFKQIDRVGVPEVLNGQVFNLSGQAISGLSNAFQMTLAERQQQVERMLEDLLDDTLWLMKEWLDPMEGMQIDGANALGNRYIVSVTDDDLDPMHYRAQVKLSSGMPKDDNNELSNLARMVQAGYLPVTELLEMYTKVKGKGAEAPQVIWQRALEERAAMNDKQVNDMMGERARAKLGLSSQMSVVSSQMGGAAMPMPEAPMPMMSAPAMPAMPAPPMPAPPMPTPPVNLPPDTSNIINMLGGQ
jgi:hypothetical protein